MKLKTLSIAGFRGFNQVREFTFHEGLNTIYAPNGLGKSSIAEAVEWLFYGETSKLRYAKSKLEFRNSLKNIHYKASTEPFVEVVLVMSDNSHIKIRREFIDDNNSTLYMNNQAVQHLESLGIFKDSTPVPVVAQNALKAFIHTEPLTRWEIISTMLGMETLSGFRSSLTSAITKFKNENEKIFGTISDMVVRLKRMNSSQLFSNLIATLEAFNREGFDAELEKVTAQILNEKPQNPLAALDVARRELMKSLTTLPQFFSEAAVTGTETMESSRTLLKQLVQCIENYAEVYPHYVASKEARKIGERISLLKQGLELTIEGDLTCPLCGEPTITPEKKESLRNEIEQHERFHTLSSRVQSTKSLLSDLVTKYINSLESNLPPNIQKDELEVWLFSSNFPQEIIEDIHQIVSGIADVTNQFRKLQGATFKALRDIEEDYQHFRFNQSSFSNFVSQIEFGSDVINKIDEIKTTINKVNERLLPFLQKRAAESEKVEHIEILIELWKNKYIFYKSFSAHAVLDRMTNLRNVTEEHEKAKTSERLEQKNSDIITWYNILNPNEDVRFSRMGLKQGKARQIDLIAELYGKKANAAAMLSEAHINATGLSVYLSQIISPLSPFKFLILDDPVQSMDFDHTSRFETDLINKLLEKDYQVIVLSHLDNVINNIKDYHRIDWDYELSNYGIEGPVILERGTKLEEYIKEARRLRNGSSVERTNAVHTLRKAIECMCKMIHTKNTGEKLTKRYQSLSSSDLKKLVGNTIASEDQNKIAYVLKYADPASHDGDNKQVTPLPGIVDSLIDQILDIAVKYIDPQIRNKTKI
jgi:DNA repair exonuclease SbcCD ATPase subunit